MTMLAWFSSLLSVPHLICGLPAVYAVLFLTIRFNLSDIGGHPRHTTWAEEVPFHLAMLAISAPLLVLGFVLLRAGRGLAVQSGAGEQAARLAGSSAGLLAMAAGLVMGILILAPRRVASSLIGTGIEQWIAVVLLAMAVWVYGYAALVRHSLTSVRKPGALRRWGIASAMLVGIVVAHLAVVQWRAGFGAAERPTDVKSEAPSEATKEADSSPGSMPIEGPAVERQPAQEQTEPLRFDAKQ
jgi:hypothetical protein